MTLSETFCRELAFALTECTTKARFANSVIQKRFAANKHWSADERSLFAESLYFSLRHLRRLHFCLSIHTSEDQKNALRVVLAALTLNHYYATASVHRELGVERAVLQQRWKDAAKSRSVAYSVPVWLDTVGEKIFGNEWQALLAACSVEPKVCLRTNTLKGSREQLIARLTEQGVKVLESPLSPDGITLLKHENVFALEEFKKGFFEVQDNGSQCIAPFCDVKPGMRVIDACAGSGGKTLHLATLMENKGRIIAMDTEEWKLADLSKRARRNGISIIETRVISSTKVVKRLYDSADRLLLDVPCSGLGVLRRNPDTKWHMQPEDIERFVVMQRDILTKYSPMVKPGECMVYATCSLLPAEGEEQIQWFLSQSHDWVLEAERRLSPHKDDCDGFYMARLRRAAKAPENAKPKTQKKSQKIDAAQIEGQTEAQTVTQTVAQSVAQSPDQTEMQHEPQTVAQSVAQDVTQDVTQAVTQAVTQDVTQNVAQPVAQIVDQTEDVIETQHASQIETQSEVQAGVEGSELNEANASSGTSSNAGSVASSPVAG